MSSSSSPSHPISLSTRLHSFRSHVHDELVSHVLPFWLEKSMDNDKDKGQGGYFNCLTPEGNVLDPKKYVWLQCRQVWTMSFLGDKEFAPHLMKKGNMGIQEDQKQEEKDVQSLQISLRQCAQHGLQFIQKHACIPLPPSSSSALTSPPHLRCYFSLHRDGTAHSLQRKLFSECFFVMANCAFAKLQGDTDSTASSHYKVGQSMFDEGVLYLLNNPSALRESVDMSGNSPQGLAVPMILLNVIHVIRQTHPNQDRTHLLSLYQKEAKWCISRIRQHVNYETKIVVENVDPQGKQQDSSYEYRLVNPGHAIECGWFILQWVSTWGDSTTNESKELLDLAKNIIDWSFDFGWDKKHGGLFSFLDSRSKAHPGKEEDFTPTVLEWSMKLWWPHTESLIAFLMLYQLNGQEKYLDHFQLVWEYCLRVFHCPEKKGEWYGYADRFGNVTNKAVGGPYKGCFHVPRGLGMSVQILDQIIEKK